MTGVLLIIFMALLVLFMAFLYLLPACIAQGRKHQSVGGICVLNFFLGWTFLGWVIALVWALSGNPKAEAMQLELNRRQLEILRQGETK